MRLQANAQGQGTRMGEYGFWIRSGTNRQIVRNGEGGMENYVAESKFR